MNTPIYIFSGLGADERAFQFIDFFEHEVVFISWIAPLHNEALKSYAARISAKITAPNPILIGLSFGGIVALEVAKIIQPSKIILISSVQSSREIPLIYKLAGMLSIHKLLPAGILRRANFITYWLFGIKRSAEKEILAAILKDTDHAFLSWAIDRVVLWKHASTFENLVQIHGTKDRLFPSYKNADVIVKGGGHLMVLERADEISLALRTLL